MCLTVNNKVTREFLTKHKNHSRVTVWKIFRRALNIKDGLNSPTFPSYNDKIKRGWFKSNRDTKDLDYQDDRTLDGRKNISRGIHVFIIKKKCIKSCKDWNHSYFKNYPPYLVVKCYAQTKDLVGCSDIKYSEAVFMKIFIPKATRKINKKKQH